MNIVILKQFRKNSLGDRTVFQHVGHTGRNPQIVFQDIKFAIAATDQVGTTDVGPDAMHGFNTLTFLAEISRIHDQFTGNNLVLENLAIVVDVIDKAVQCLETLLQAFAGFIPFTGRNNARNNVEGPFTVDIAGITVHGERDAHGLDGINDRGFALVDFLRFEGR